MAMAPNIRSWKWSRSLAKSQWHPCHDLLTNPEQPLGPTRDLPTNRPSQSQRQKLLVTGLALCATVLFDWLGPRFIAGPHASAQTSNVLRRSDLQH